MKTRVFGMAAILGVFVLTTAVATPPVAARSPKKFSIVELNVGGGCPGYPSAINNLGEVVGIADDPPASCGDTTAALWRHGVMTNLGQHVATDINDRGQVIGFEDFATIRGFVWDRGVRTFISLGGNSLANAINERGQVVGRSNLAGSFASLSHAYLFQDGSIVDLGTLPGNNDSSANDINERGQIVGMSVGEPTPGNHAVRAVLWEKGAIVDLGTLGGGFSEAAAINNRGQVVGTSTTAAGDRRAFLWQDGVMVDLGTLGGNESAAHAINRRGQIIGSSANAAGEPRAFLWDDGVLRDLGTLGGNSTFAAAINNHGAVVGRSTIAGGETRAFLWQDGVMTDLNPDPLVEFANASDINDRGAIVGRVDSIAVVWVPRDGDKHHDRHRRKHHVRHGR